MSGVMATTGYADRPPVKAGAAVADFFGAVHLYSAAVTALVEAQRSGRGRFVEASMLEAVFPTLSSPLGLYHGLHNQNPPRTGNRHSGLSEAPYNVYPAQDGFIALFCVTEAHWAGLAAAMGKQDLLTDPRFSDLKARVANIDALDEIITEWTVARSKADLLEVTDRFRVPRAPVRELDEVVNDEHMHARGSLKRVSHPDLGDVVLPTGPLRYGGSDVRELEPSRAIGADNTSVYGEWLGRTTEEIAALTASGAI
jgi:crotonobetainyl-CoA:carnitine CoA-transferase CaiB-like acyl-CoA transferase